jgi:Na+-transporting NADH:ubiquinone oxidoreductase subunit NqrD
VSATAAVFGKHERTALVAPIIANNPIGVQVLGICSALAVTTRLDKALVMGIGVTIVTACANIAVSTVRNWIPNSIRIIVQLAIIASLVIMVDQVLKAYLYELSLELSVFHFIITNHRHGPRRGCDAVPAGRRSDGVGNGLRYSFVLLLAPRRARRRRQDLRLRRAAGGLRRGLVRAQRADAACSVGTLPHRASRLAAAHVEARAAGKGLR